MDDGGAWFEFEVHFALHQMTFYGRTVSAGFFSFAGPHRTVAGHRAWVHICLGLDAAAKVFTVYEGGEKGHQGEFDKWSAFPADFLEVRPTSLELLVLGASLPDRGKQRFMSVTSVNIFSRLLTKDEMSRITGCQVNLK